jgi:hypothetical protein
MKSINKGDKVKMTEKLKISLMSNGCEDHVIEFGNCIGIVEDRCYPNINEATEVNVRWQPSGLRYGYFPDELEKIKD